MSAEANDVLIIGNGGREHALAWKLLQSPDVSGVFVAPGNGGTEFPLLGKRSRNVDIGVGELDKLARHVRDNKIGLTVVGPENPLALGIVDLFSEEGLRIFGPTRKAAQLESSKIFAAEFMSRHNIPQAAYLAFDSSHEARRFLSYQFPQKVVIKADGLAAGKGVTLPETPTEADFAVVDMMLEGKFGDAGNRIIIAERLVGREVSMIAVSDGKNIATFVPTADRKRLLDGDMGPNTGGMGCYAPAPITPEEYEFIKNDILQKAVDGMREEGSFYRGALYAGIMLTGNGPKVLEFNCRFGDPETQVQMRLLNSDLFRLLNACVDGSLDPNILWIGNGASVCTVMASEGYPDSPVTGKVIDGLDRIYDDSVVVFHAGSRKKDFINFTNGGRVLGITATGRDLKDAQERALKAAELIGFEGTQRFRRDIVPPKFLR